MALEALFLIDQGKAASWRQRMSGSKETRTILMEGIKTGALKVFLRAILFMTLGREWGFTSIFTDPTENPREQPSTA